MVTRSLGHRKMLHAEKHGIIYTRFMKCPYIETMHRPTGQMSKQHTTERVLWLLSGN